MSNNKTEKETAESLLLAVKCSDIATEIVLDAINNSDILTPEIEEKLRSSIMYKMKSEIELARAEERQRCAEAVQQTEIYLYPVPIKQEHRNKFHEYSMNARKCIAKAIRKLGEGKDE